jgi:hypothetical protein
MREDMPSMTIPLCRVKGALMRIRAMRQPQSDAIRLQGNFSANQKVYAEKIWLPDR